MSLNQVTIKDIAKSLGISIATVSRALNGSNEINSQTKERILLKVKELNYRPNIHARNLIKKQNNMIGVVVPEFVTFFFPEIIIGIQEVVNKLGYQVLICQSNESSSLEYQNVKMLEENMVDGLIVSVAKDSRNVDLYKRLIRERMPIVFVNRAISGLNASQVVIDDRKWAFKVTEHLIKCGYKRIAHLAGNIDLMVTKERLQGYLDALIAYDIPIRENLIMYVGVQQDRAKIGIDYLMSLKEKPDAIFAINDPIAVGSILELKKRGFEIPNDVAVAGFSESPIGRIMDLTSVFQPTLQMGRKAAELLMKHIINPNTPVETIIFEAKLNIRHSTLPLRKLK